MPETAPSTVSSPPADTVRFPFTSEPAFKFNPSDSLTVKPCPLPVNANANEPTVVVSGPETLAPRRSSEPAVIRDVTLMAPGACNSTLPSATFSGTRMSIVPPLCNRIDWPGKVVRFVIVRLPVTVRSMSSIHPA